MFESVTSPAAARVTGQRGEARRGAAWRQGHKYGAKLALRRGL